MIHIYAFRSVYLFYPRLKLKYAITRWSEGIRWFAFDHWTIPSEATSQWTVQIKFPSGLVYACGVWKFYFMQFALLILKVLNHDIWLCNYNRKIYWHEFVNSRQFKIQLSQTNTWVLRCYFFETLINCSMHMDNLNSSTIGLMKSQLELTIKTRISNLWLC